MTDETQSVSIRGLANTTLILSIIAIIIEVGAIVMIYAQPMIERISLLLSNPVLYNIFFWGGIVLILISGIMIGVAKNRNPDPNDGDRKKLSVASILCIIFIIMLIAEIFISIFTHGTVFY